MCSSTDSTKMAETPKSTRRSNKPLMERRRRERINHCLNELKNLVLTAQRKDPTRYSKLEKADILEMTVRHVQTLHRQETGSSRTANNPQPSVDATAKYSAGYTKCAAEVSRFLSGVSGLPQDLHARVLSHLSSATNAEYAVTTSRSPPSKDNSEQGFTSRYPQKQQAPIARVPVGEASSGNTSGHIPLWTRAPTASGSPPTNATSPEAAGAPSSPESARGSPNMTLPEDSTCDNSLSTINLNAIKFHCSGPSTADHSRISCKSRIQEDDLQVAPLDLATSNRRLTTTDNTTTSPTSSTTSYRISVQALPTQMHMQKSSSVFYSRGGDSHNTSKNLHVSAASKGEVLELLNHSKREVRHAPYPAHNQQALHWRPW